MKAGLWIREAKQWAKTEAKRLSGAAELVEDSVCSSGQMTHFTLHILLLSFSILFFR